MAASIQRALSEELRDRELRALEHSSTRARLTEAEALIHRLGIEISKGTSRENKEKQWADAVVQHSANLKEEVRALQELVDKLITEKTALEFAHQELMVEKTALESAHQEARSAIETRAAEVVENTKALIRIVE